MEDLKKVQQYIDRVKQIKLNPMRVSKEQASRMMGCSLKTVQRYAKKCNVRMFEGSHNEWYYHFSGVQKMILRKEYNGNIRRFFKKSKAGYYEKRS